MAVVETKVTAGSLAAGASGVVLYVLRTWVFKNGVPAGIESLIYLLVPALLAGVAGWLAPHTSRPGDVPAGSPAGAPPS